MTAQFDIVVSSENCQYLAWQTQLFCFSALTKLNLFPIIIVHRTREPLREEFSILRERGFHVVEAPSFSKYRSGNYPPRNEIGTLVTLASGIHLRKEHVLFCEPDMLFAGVPSYTGSIAGEFYSYLDYGKKHVVRAANKLGVADRTAILASHYRIGVPYFLPTAILMDLAQRWLRALDAFEVLDWIDIMYAFGFSLLSADIMPETTFGMTDNRDNDASLVRPILHYCYGDNSWSKRAFIDQSPLSTRMRSRAAPGTVLREIEIQIAQAKQYFGYTSRFQKALDRILLRPKQLRGSARRQKWG